MSLVILLYCAVLMAVNNAYADIDDYCTTPDDKFGQCVLIKNCPKLLNLLINRPISGENLQFLQKSNCGYIRLDPIVCCEIEQEAEEETVNRNSPTTTKEPIIPTQDLLPTKEDCTLIESSPLYIGEYATIFEFPWTVLLEYKKPSNEDFHCGGVLINSRYVLTAAHCIKGKNIPTSWFLDSVIIAEHDIDMRQDCMINIGTIRCTGGPLTILIEEQIAHEEFDPDDLNQYHDIALLRLVREVVYTDFIKPICLPTEQVIGHRFVSGWGKSVIYSESSKKLKMNVSLVDHDYCSHLYKDGGITVSRGQLCAGGNLEQDSCSGDSGGGLMTGVEREDDKIAWYVEGIMAFGPEPCVFPGRPVVYTKVIEYIPWIHSKIKP